MTTLRQVVEENDTRWGRVFDLVVQGLIVLSLISFSIETLPDLPPWSRTLLRVFEVATIAVFTAEYLLRLYVAERKLRFVFSVYGLIDLIAVLPFYLMLGFDLRAARIIRVMRLFRAFKLVRYSKAMLRFHRALLLAREEIVLFLVASFILLYFSSVGIYYFEHEAQPEKFASVFHAAWWAVCTISTVGYGDVYPITAGGRIFTMVVLLLGIGFISVPAGLLAASLGKVRELED